MCSLHRTGDNSTTGSSIAQQCGILPDGCEQLIAADHLDVLAELRSLGPPPGVTASLDSAAAVSDDSTARSSVGRHAVARHHALRSSCMLIWWTDEYLKYSTPSHWTNGLFMFVAECASGCHVKAAGGWVTTVARSIW
jgi:hypothetical protein